MEIKVEWLKEAYDRLNCLRISPHEEWPIPCIRGMLEIGKYGIEITLIIEGDELHERLGVKRAVFWDELGAAKSNVLLVGINKAIDVMACTYKERYPESQDSRVRQESD